MKKILLTLFIAASLISCSTVKNKDQESKKITKKMNKQKLYTEGQYYEEDKTLYDTYIDEKLDGVIKRFDDSSKENDYYVVSSYKKGKLKNKKYIKKDDKHLSANINYKDGILDGKMTYSAYVGSKEYFFSGVNFENGILQDYCYFKVEGKVIARYQIVNSINHGKVIVNKTGEKEEVFYYNKGEKVDSESQIKNFEKLNIENAVKFSNLIEKDSLYYTKDNKLFNGVAHLKTLNSMGETLFNYLYIKNGELQKKFEFIQTEYYKQYNSPLYYELEKMYEFKTDSTIISTYYKGLKQKEVIKDNKTDKIIKEYQFDRSGKRITIDK